MHKKLILTIDVTGFPEKLNRTKRNVTAQSSITILMDAAGGWAGVITRNK